MQLPQKEFFVEYGEKKTILKSKICFQDLDDLQMSKKSEFIEELWVNVNIHKMNDKYLKRLQRVSIF